MGERWLSNWEVDDLIPYGGMYIPITLISNYVFEEGPQHLEFEWSLQLTFIISKYGFTHVYLYIQIHMYVCR